MACVIPVMRQLLSANGREVVSQNKQCMRKACRELSRVVCGLQETLGLRLYTRCYLASLSLEPFYPLGNIPRLIITWLSSHFPGPVAQDRCGWLSMWGLTRKRQFMDGSWSLSYEHLQEKVEYKERVHAHPMI